MKKFFTTLIALLSLPMLITAQKLDMDAFKQLKPRNIGPAGMSGRITSIDVVTEMPDIIYAGSASGGMWKSTNGGIKWESVFDDQTTASVGAITIQQSNPAVIWVGTGEGNPRNSLNGGDGIYKSMDRGKTWEKMGLEKTRNIHRIIIHPNNPMIVYVAAIGSPWGTHPERGVYKTTDGGISWIRILYSNTRTGACDLVMDPTNPNKLIAAMWEYKREPWFFESGGSGSGIHVTHDGGNTWHKKTDEDGLPEGETGRTGLAISQSRPNVVYALIEAEKNALYRSEDGGESWKRINDKKDIGNRPFYYSDIYVDPINENRVYSIFTYVNVSIDGGKNFTQLMPAYGVSNGVHPDHHAWYIHPKNPDYIIDGNDGGLNISRDRGKTWQFVENLPVGQFYHVAVDDEWPYNVYGGMQDNGSWVGPAYVFRTQGIRNHYWQEISFGDGFDVLPDPENSRFGISTAQQGYAGIYDRETGYFELIRPTLPDSNIELRFNWNAGMARDPFDPATVYFGSQYVHKSTDRGQTWEIISGDLTTNDPEKQKQGESGGLTMDATGAENYCTILVITPSPLRKDLLWVGTDDGRVHISKNGGKSWDDVSRNIPEMPKGSWIAQIKASNKNEGEALLVANDYRRFNDEPYAFRTKDFGTSWERIVDGNDVVGYALSIVEDPEEKKLLFLGTDDGLHISIDAGINWTKWTAGFPTTNAYDLTVHPREHDLVIGTFGRAFWILDDIRPLRELAQKGLDELEKTVKLYPVPPAYQVAVQQPTGSRFGGDALFNGKNRPEGAMITYSINLSKEQEKEDKSIEKKKNDKEKPQEEDTQEGSPSLDTVKIEIFKGDKLIRTLKHKTPEENGMHRVYWKLDESGPKRMTREKLKNTSEPSGVDALPGIYKIQITLGEQKDSVEVEVKFDPRFKITSDDLNAKYDALKQLEADYGLANMAVERIKESLKILGEYKNKMTQKDEEELKDQIEQCEIASDTLNTMLDVFLGKEDKRQGITRSQPNSINNTYFNAVRYVSGGMHAPGATEQELIEKFQNDLEATLKMVNGYYNKEWSVLRKTLEVIDLSPFKAYEDIE